MTPRTRTLLATLFAPLLLPASGCTGMCPVPGPVLSTTAVQRFTHEAVTRDREVMQAQRIAAEPVQKLLLQTEVLFTFDRHGRADILPGGLEKIHTFARMSRDSKQHRRGWRRIIVTAHADRLGSRDYNNALSLKRALTVREVLLEDGFSPVLVEAYAKGASVPLKSCPQRLRSQALQDCLQPNRRVVLEVR